MIHIVSPEAVNPAVRDKTYRERLFRASSACYGSMSWARNFFRKMTMEYAGPNYGVQEGAKVKYLNKTAQFINAWASVLAGSCPQADVRTNYRELMPFARHWSVNLNAHMERTRFKDEFQECAKNAIILMGIMKCHYADSGQVIFEQDVAMDPGHAFASSISIEDYVFDMSVKREGRCRFAGDKFRMTLADLWAGVDMGIHSEEAAELIQATSKMEHDKDRAELISVGQETDDDEVEPAFDVVELYDYEDKVCRLYALQDTRTMMPKGIEISESEWKGMSWGPYNTYRLYTMPDNIMPKSLVGDLEALDRFINNMARKTAQQAYNQKENMVYTPAGKATAEALATAKPFESIQVSDIRDVDVIRQGGVDPGTAQILGNFLQLYDEMGGNLKQMLGLAASADTLGQEQIIQQAGSKMGSFLEDRFYDCAEKTLANVSALQWGDQFQVISSSINVDSTGPTPLEVDSSWRPGDREGELWQYYFKIVPCSMRLQSPTEKVALLMQIMDKYAVFQEHIMAQGGVIDMFSINEYLADNLRFPELRNFLTFQSGTGGGPPLPDTAGKPPVSNRNYTRKSIGASQLGMNTSDWNIGSSGGTPQQSRKQRLY